MTFASLLGNEELKAAWQHALHGRFPQSILLTGPKGIGKLTAARVLTMALLCESTGEKPCGQCAACRKVEQNYHSDVTCIDAGDTEIKVDTARRIRSECAVYPGDSDRRIFLIRHAQNMNAAAQNALLKLLEERKQKFAAEGLKVPSCRRFCRAARNMPWCRWIPAVSCSCCADSIRIKTAQCCNAPPQAVRASRVTRWRHSAMRRKK